MSLRQRIVLTLVGISVLLAIPAAYGLRALKDVHEITRRLDERGVGGTEALGDLRNSVETANDAQRRYVALYPVGTLAGGNPADTIGPRLQVDSAADGARRALAVLKGEPAYAGASAPAEQLWAAIAPMIAREREVLAAGNRAAA
ncbi:MAG TPA: hypothetical protein VGX50_14955, partial [Longimicrobium sp.]|nr:hypothetical protein [Longimicrobium sp.]